MTTSLKDIIPDYLIYNIITPILDYLLLSDKDYNSETRLKYSITLLNDNTKNEIIKLSLVSKKWFNIVTTSISNNITNHYNLHRWMNKECIDHITYSNYSDTTDGVIKTVYIKVLKINASFSIIKIDPKIIYNYFKSKCQIIDDNYQYQLEDGDHLKSHDKTIFNIDTTELLKNELSLELSDILSGLNTSLLTSDNCEMEFNLNNMKLESIEQIDKIIGLVTNNSKRNNFIVNSITIDGSGIIDKDIFNYIIENFKPNKIKINSNGGYDLNYHFNYSWLFTCSNLESINIKKDDHMEPSYFSTLPLVSSNLKSLSFSFLFHDMIKIIRQDNIGYNECFSELESFNNPESIEEQFQIMIQQLSNNKSIKKLKVSNFCEFGQSCTKLLNKPCTLHPISTINPTYCTMGNGVYCFTKRKENQIKLNQHAKTIINQGFKSIFEINSTIEWFKISSLEIIDESFFSGLIKNSTIKTLVVKSTYCEISNKVFDYLVSDVLTVNKSIKHLIIRNDIIQNIFKLLLKHQNEISLYSINLITTFNNINDLIKLIESSTSIVEFNVSFRNTDDDENSILSRNEFSNLLNKNTNNKVINIF